MLYSTLQYFPPNSTNINTNKHQHQPSPPALGICCALNPRRLSHPPRSPFLGTEGVPAGWLAFGQRERERERETVRVLGAAPNHSVLFRGSLQYHPLPPLPPLPPPPTGTARSERWPPFPLKTRQSHTLSRILLRASLGAYEAPELILRSVGRSVGTVQYSTVPLYSTSLGAAESWRVLLSY